jgi:hypothetical protein
VKRRDAVTAPTSAAATTHEAGSAAQSTATITPEPSGRSAPIPLPSGSSGKKKAHGKDAGAPAPDRDKDEAERNATLGHAAEQSCNYHTQQMTTFAQDEASRKHAAEVAKGFMCRGMISSRCERQVCLNACMVLNDSMCIQQITYVIDHGPPPKY